MKITELSIKNKTLSFVLVALLICGGVFAYQNLGRLEFPDFTIKTAIITTAYPGATPMEVEQEVTDIIETAVQQISQIKEARSISRAGLSIIYVDIKDTFLSSDMPQIWDELRRKVTDVQPKIPPGCMPSLVNDDFGDVYGVFFAVYGDGYTYKELKDYADILKRELLLVTDVASVETWGEQQEVVYLEISRARMAEMGISLSDIAQVLNGQDQVVDSGKVRVGGDHVRIDPTGNFDSVEDLGDLFIRSDGEGSVIRLNDIAVIKRGYEEPTRCLMRYNGQPALGLGVATVSDGNVVTMGEAVGQRIEELSGQAPVGMELGVIAYQSAAVTESVNNFVINLVQAVVIVIGVLCLAMGLASGVLMGGILLLTIMGTFIAMHVMGVSLQLISLGALILALGMLVDNAIVVTEGILVNVQQGMSRTKAALSTVSQTAWPLLAATFVAVLAFAAIGTSRDTSGDFLGSLFKVMAVSLSLSWVLAITLTPLFCVQFMPKAKKEEKKDPYSGKFFRIYRTFLTFCLKRRGFVIMVLLGAFASGIYGFSRVEESFFPHSNRPQFMIDYFRSEGTHIDEVSEDLKKLEAYLSTLENVTETATFIGQGALRFILTYDPEMPSSSYGQVLVTVKDYRKIPDMFPFLRRYLASAFPDSETKLTPFNIGPGSGSKIQARFRGPDPEVLRSLSLKAQEIMADDPLAINIRDDWRQKVKVVRPGISKAKARRMGVARPNVADALKAVVSGKQIGLYRESNQLIPIVARAPEQERVGPESIRDVQVISPITGKSLNLQQIIKEMNNEWEDPIIRRRNRQRTIIPQCDQSEGNASALLARLRPRMEKIPLPDGYELDWGGEYEDSADAKKSLFRMIPVYFVAMVLTVIGLFNGLRQTAIIFLCLPLAAVGVAAGLLTSGQPFSFMCLLGFLGLSGMLIKNGVVLIDQIDLEIRKGKSAYDSIIDSSLSRLRPVAMAAMTTVLGMMPLLKDPFYVGMSVTIMAGLAFGTLLTLVVVPIFYAIFFRVKSPGKEPLEEKVSQGEHEEIAEGMEAQHV